LPDALGRGLELLVELGLDVFLERIRADLLGPSVASLPPLTDSSGPGLSLAGAVNVLASVGEPESLAPGSLA